MTKLTVHDRGAAQHDDPIGSIRPVGHNMRMRKVLVGLTATAIVLGIVILGAVGIDFGPASTRNTGCRPAYARLRTWGRTRLSPSSASRSFRKR
ncbi:hypothetical protein I551_0749 [Mycobacterium ulcerans str. Harvey]|uniref:Uncharacterized protein n=1 Tax=Mycobacterium ulcerans str. Harvey TaxID=1299332 RepID=A0ABN0R691_MYCUL|nr:hypothetical protein I551_0749 [Mycobacterium ulcerans str. Harvey]